MNFFLVIAVINFAYGAFLLKRTQNWTLNFATIDKQGIANRSKISWIDDDGERHFSDVSFLAPIFIANPLPILVNYEDQRVHVVGYEKVFFAIGTLALVIQIISLFALNQALNLLEKFS